MTATTQEDLHDAFLRLGFKNDTRREKAFKALVEKVLARLDFEVNTKHSTRYLDVDNLRLALFNFIVEYGHKAWPSRKQDGRHLAAFNGCNGNQTKGRIFSIRLDAHLNHPAKRTFRKRHGWLAKPDELTNVAESALGKALKHYFCVLLRGGISEVEEDEDLLIAQVLSV